ncbi:hypothetical protein CWM47_29215 [Spirosoma pollinicola]|uniref:Muconolactone isomerase domain-containing protein n=1 Tax=Spirosoma pollinicola TaxID=2057025 RepID=A0A2K8ZCF2_9BACT|nr:hypothetical protein CWM47_29215 [Spirosoma pollinicola]
MIAIGHLTESGLSPTDRHSVMLQEVPATLKLYLDGKIDQWFAKPDQTGVIFILNVTDVEEAKNLLEALPLGIAGMMEFDLIPVGPLSPLRMLIS